MARTKKTKITPQDLYDLRNVTGAAISPDGKNVAYTVQRIDRSKEKKYSNIWIVPTTIGKTRQFTHGSQNDRDPKWSPDGSEIAFLSNREDEKQFQLNVIPFNGGEAQRITDLKGTISAFEWSPDSREFVISFRKKDKEEIERENDPSKKELGVVYRRFDRTFFKLDGDGFLPKERYHIHIVNKRSGKTAQITDSPVFDNIQPKWSPDGKRLLYISNREEKPDLDPYFKDIFIFDIGKKKEMRMDLPKGEKFDACFSPDMKWIAFTGKEGRGKWWRLKRLYIIPVKGGEERLCLTSDKDVEIGNVTLNDVESHPFTSPLTWSPDSSRIYFQTPEQGRTKLAYVDIGEKGNPIHYLIDDVCVVGAFSFDLSGRRYAYHRMDIHDPGNIWTGVIGADGQKKLTKLNSLISRAASAMEVEEHWIGTDDGKKVHGWIMKPPDFNKRIKYPSVLEIHGGPRAQYGFTFMHEFFYLASEGYVVHFCNPRGGQGYGEEHAGSIWKAWGTHDYDDISTWTDFISGLPYIDSKRMGVSGGSYGGYMTNLIIGKTDRFSAAVTQRSVSNFISMWGSSDFNWYFQDEFSEKPPWEDLDNYWKQSPMKYIGNARTPTLIIHSENDLRCDMEQGEQVYVALQRLGVPAELLRFPDSPHGLSRMGRTDRRIARLEHIRNWFERYL
ncbi:MAG: prolyl oligopeptidase family serine peptidase [Thermoplasmatota archaeon]